MKIRQVYWHMNDQQHMGEDNYKFCPRCGKPLNSKMIDNHDRCACDDCGFVHFRNPSPTVSLFILDGYKILLGKRKTDPGGDAWATPSGYIEFNEDYLTTAVREAREETGLDIEPVEIIAVTDSFFPPDQHFLNLYLSAIVVGGQLKAGDDVADLAWFQLDAPLPRMAFQEDIDLIESYREVIK